MAQISWPRRKIRITRETVANTFSVQDERDRNAVGLYDEVYVNVTDNNWHQSGATPHYIQPAAKAGHFELSESEYGGTAVSLPGNNTIWKDVGVIVNYPARPLLRDRGKTDNVSLTNPFHTNPYTISEGIYEGSIALDVYDSNDIPIVEAFIDQLARAEAWFECPLPSEHLGEVASSDILYIEASRPQDDQIELDGPSADLNLQGYFARVSRATGNENNRTCRIITDEIFEGKHRIQIVPPLFDRINTKDADKPSFAPTNTIRVRPTNVSAAGDSDYEAGWVIQWVETRGDDD